jgi:outer membrane protein insertion porin family/translocation and assembly module TamA
MSPLATAAAQDIECQRGDLEVMRLEFEGNHAFSDADLAKTIVTTPSAWARRYLHLPFTVKHCLDRTELPNDRARLIIFYRRRGYPRVTVDTAVKELAPGAVAVSFKINEGPPTVLRSFVVSGLDSVPGQRRILRGLSVREGNRFDRYAIDAAADSIRERLHNTGYPRGVAINSFYANDSALMAWDTIYVSPGPRTRIGAIDIEVTPMPNKKQQIPTKVVRQILGLDSGNLFREDQILDAQRAIYQTEAYQHVSITPDSGEDSVVALHVSLAEAAMHAARVGAGYGTLDCLRITGEYTDYNFLNGARRMDITGRLSKIGIGVPTDFAPGLCPAAKNDVFSDSVNYYLGATLRQPLFLGLRTVPTITVYTQRQSEYNAYRRTTLIGGVASVLWRGLTRSPVNLSYSMDLGRTEAQPALFCAVFNLCDATEREKVQQTQRLAVLALGTTRNTSNSILSPTRGSTIHLETRYSGPVILSDSGLQFTKVLGDASRYISMGGGNVLAMRLRGGTFVGRSVTSATNFIPPQERLYAGGPTSVRGFAQNELGSLLYVSQSFTVVPPHDFVTDTTVVDSVYRRIVPGGGNTLLVGNLEMRLRSPVLPDVLQITLFTDAGEVWNRGGGTTLNRVKLKVTPGVQFTAFSPVGPVRVAIGYNPYRRPPGPLYYEATNEGGELVCVTPGNSIPTHITTNTDGVVTNIKQDSGFCPSDFQPAKENGFLKKLTFSFAIGQAF